MMGRYSNFNGVNVLDISKDKEEGLLQAENLFNTLIEATESYIAKKLREKTEAHQKQMRCSVFPLNSKFFSLAPSTRVSC